MMPTSTTQQKQEKIRDMKALGRWYANALSPNEGFAGTLKPDYVGYHHNSYYASAYTPHALHKAALIQYLLSGTAFTFGENHLSTTGNKSILLLSLHHLRKDYRCQISCGFVADDFLFFFFILLEYYKKIFVIS